MNDKDLDKITEGAKEIFIGILNKYIYKTENMEDFLELEEITTGMIMELKEKSHLSAMSFDDYMVRDVVKNTLQFDEEYKDYTIDEDRMNWITREYHDSYFDYDQVKNDVKKAMDYTEKHYVE